MLTIVVPGLELYDEQLDQFATIDVTVLELEHSLVSLSKWEAIHEKPFLSETSKTPEELLSYIKMMVLTPDVPDDVFFRLSDKNIETIDTYINSKQSATWFNDQTTRPRHRETVTTELIYYWMVSYNIPFECQHWHLNRLLTLIRILNVKNSPSKKMSRNEIAARNRELNARRRAQLGTTG